MKRTTSPQRSPARLRAAAMTALSVLVVTAAAFPAVAAAAGSGTIVNFAGNASGVAGNSGDDNLATSASLSFPAWVAADSAGNVYIADAGNNRVRKVNTAGTITNFAGSPAGTPGNTGDGALATSATLSNPEGVAVDSAGNVYIADNANARVRKVNTAGTITNFAGSPAGTAGNTGDGGPATSATLGARFGVSVDSAGNVYIADYGNNRVRKVDTAGTITNFAGSPAATAGNTGDGGLATSATLSRPKVVAVDSAGNVYIADTGNNRVREVLAATTVSVIRPAPGLITGGALLVMLLVLGLRASRRPTVGTNVA